nr:hypothetical protein [Tanacetum cinerariifolium]
TTVICFLELFPLSPDVYVLDVPAAKELIIGRRIPKSNNSSQEQHHTDMVIHTVKTDMVIHTTKTEMMKLVVEIKCVGMNVDEFDKKTGSSDGLKPDEIMSALVRRIGDILSNPDTTDECKGQELPTSDDDSWMYNPAIQQVHLPQQCSCGEQDVLIVFQMAHTLALQMFSSEDDKDLARGMEL